MQLPFTPEQFFGVFRSYNEAVWPVQVPLVLLALLAVYLVLVPRRWSGRAVSLILGFLWVWLALAYHLSFFAGINKLAYVFAAISMAGASTFLWQGVLRNRLQFAAGGMRAYAGAVLLLYALVVYPAWSWLAGHRYPAMPTFGLPCPTTIFTVGMLAFLSVPYPRAPLVVPLLWCAVGAQAAFLLGVPQDLGLIAAGAVALALMARPARPAGVQ